jgi:5-formyltetrahydrofolate cyclo-ligase
MSIRERLQQQRKNLTAKQQQQLSAQITKRVLTHNTVQKAQHIACYLAMNGEVSTHALIENLWQQHKTCYLPIITQQTLQFVAYTPSSKLIKSEFGFLQPEATENYIDAPQLDLVITPLVAFNAQCTRMGMGAGYYDRTFEFLNVTNRPAQPIMIGVAYEFQKLPLDALQKQSWDVNLNYVITDQHCYAPSYLD